MKLKALCLGFVVFSYSYITTASEDSQFQDSNFGSQNGQYHITYYRPHEMPVECKIPPGFSFDQGIAVVEGDSIIDGATCSGWSSGVPDCTRVLQAKNLCGTIIELDYSGKKVRGWLTGVCPWDHPTNAAKGAWNPCGRGRKNLDLMESLYFQLGLSAANSWGPDTSQNPWQENPQAVYINAYKVDKIEGVGTIH